MEIVYLTTQEKKPLPTHVKINSAKAPSTALCEQIATVNKGKVGKYIGECSPAEMKRIDEALAVSIGIGMKFKSDALIKKWAEATEENEQKPPKILRSEETKLPDIEMQLEIAKIAAERDVYKRLYEEMISERE